MSEILLTADQSMTLETALGQVTVRDIAGQVVGYVHAHTKAADSPKPLGDDFESLDLLISMTHRLIPGQIAVEESVDPEYPETTYIVFRVKPDRKPSNLDALIDLELAWHRQVADIAPRERARIRLLFE